MKPEQNEIDSGKETGESRNYDTLFGYGLASGEEYPALPSGYNRSSLDYLYIAIYGESIHKNGFDRISLNFGKVRLNHGRISDLEFQELKAYLELEKEYDDIHLMMISSKNSLDSGMEKLALLQMVIVGQMAVNGYVKKKTKEGGVSNRRFSKYGNRIPYGQTLNVLFPPLCPKKKPQGKMLDILNEARDKRNTLIHEGKMNASKEDLYKYYAATKELIEYIASIENIFKEDKKTSGSDKENRLSSQASSGQVSPLK